MIGIEQARAWYQGADAAHDFDHVLRVLRLAERIGEAEGANMAIVRAAALLHDVGRAEAGGGDHAAASAARARELLIGHPYEQVEAVAQAISAHRFRTGPEPQTLEAQVLFDADKLDAIGAVGVARVFARGGASGQRLWAAREDISLERWLAEGDDLSQHTPVHEYVVKLVRLKDQLYTTAGRAIAEDRHNFLVAFFERFDAEVRGQL